MYWNIYGIPLFEIFAKGFWGILSILLWCFERYGIKLNLDKFLEFSVRYVGLNLVDYLEFDIQNPRWKCTCADISENTNGFDCLTDRGWVSWCLLSAQSCQQVEMYCSNILQSQQRRRANWMKRRKFMLILISNLQVIYGRPDGDFTLCHICRLHPPN